MYCWCFRRDVGPRCTVGDCHISQHYKLLLRLFLECLKAPGLLFLEDDLEIAPDFFSYFEATVPLMAEDSSIYCISAWNDHGQLGRVKDNTALYRTDVMPGLGWYISSKIGLELAPKWPLTNWDDWMRMPAIKAGRSCIYPEVRGLFGKVSELMGDFHGGYSPLLCVPQHQALGVVPPCPGPLPRGKGGIHTHRALTLPIPAAP